MSKNSGVAILSKCGGIRGAATCRYALFLIVNAPLAYHVNNHNAVESGLLGNQLYGTAFLDIQVLIIWGP